MSSISRRQFIQRASALLASTSFSSQLIAADATNNNVGVVLDALFFKHDLAEHPENAKRLQVIDEILTIDNIWAQLTPVKGRFATEDELLSCHNAGYIEEIRLLSEQKPGFYNEYQIQ